MKAGLLTISSLIIDNFIIIKYIESTMPFVNDDKFSYPCHKDIDDNF